jgi:hypothetical protein
MSVIFYFLLAFNIGLFKFPAGRWQAFGDFMNLSFFIISIIKYQRQRKILSYTTFSFLEKSWIVFLIYFVISAIISPSTSKYGSIGNLRLAYPYFLFFSSVALLTSQDKIRSFLKVLVVYAVIGGVLSIIQSFYGVVPIFDIKGFYNIGHWGGQQLYIIPGIARVMLPPLYLIYIVFIALVYNEILFHDHQYSILLLFFLVTILIGFARSLWVATVLTVLITMIAVMGINILDLKKLIKLSALIITAVTLGFIIVINIFGDSFLLALTNRYFLLFSDIEYGQGTFGSRLITMGDSIKLWLKNPYWGNGAAYTSITKMYRLSDVGFTYVLVTIGIVGMILVMNLYLSVVVFSYHMIKLSLKIKNKNLLLAGIISFSIPVFFLCCQQFTQSTFMYVLLALGSGYCAAQYKINLRNNLRFTSASEKTNY